ncbi:M23 family metallopeptidase [Acinetobacter sp. MD2(2019)]|uniref:M23 family metallopeptidase n=1 Tax=Acinetobacter sp. MD2(2019) TaxID=2605273 RepID=UPI002D1EC7A8|nr:M23 family metallopeptidase [Acinetobacter sp. MD2(2019)]MEB3753118.1 M23 family metallopeptidase [Acinetobacter sp. MD2(2019)]
MRRILFALSLLVATPVVFADLIETQPASSPDQLEKLSRTLSTGSYNTAEESNSSATQLNVKLRQNSSKSVSFDNSSVKKYMASSSSTGSSNWMKANPLPDMVRVSSEFGMRSLLGTTRPHEGIDLSAPTGTSIYAAGAGVVTRAGWVNGYGQFVEVNHGNGFITRYGHASRVLVGVGDHVTAGEEIAKVGCTGRCTGPHLHFEVVKDGTRKNPSTYLAMLP